MDLQITGKIIQQLEPKSGTSQRSGNSWVAQSYVIETVEQYPKKCVFEVFGNDKIAEFGIQVGEELTVKINIEAHEHNGRWFNNIRAWAVERADTAQPAPQPQVAEPAPQPSPVQQDNTIPFTNNDSLPW